MRDLIRLGYRPSLDGLRAIAVLVVMAFHAYLPGFSGGALGVDIFFILSGFLITSILLEEWRRDSDISLRNFYFRRAFRLLPALGALLLVIQLHSLAVFHGARFWDSEKAIAAVLCYVANWVRALDLFPLGSLAHAWSLSIEEQFYLVFPLLLLFLLRRKVGRSWLFTGLLAAVVILALHRAFLWTGPNSEERIFNGSDTRFDELLTGCAAAVGLQAGLFTSPRVLKVLRYALIPAMLTLGVMIVHPPPVELLYKFGWPAIELSVACIVLWLVLRASTPVHRILELPAAVWIGRISYGLYLWHVPIISRVGGWHRELGPLTVPVGFGLSFGAAIVSYYCLEVRFLKMKARLPASQPNTTSVAETATRTRSLGRVAMPMAHTNPDE
jgi:peptidoglycan/LPS O-acetylase OafA/YrhL